MRRSVRGSQQRIAAINSLTNRGRTCKVRCAARGIASFKPLLPQPIIRLSVGCS
ncbi:uncharacterized protein BDR25DRAFT_104877 [Lindgomyces ingoldianus]|uniref:Uncharacterized protein n=1 Tax=Lindgomyces ingoldianus TaxID=673940 RepID=A0ACB6QAB3_9PLEO|nr:uncharacterized protein BDR25DRAFT_104877 [Lindgomyces ingoldianus]KAF2463863.1 hypothetical protein BDR25DRAFT_104877 [Lindgomyces ingoldianus]